MTSDFAKNIVTDKLITDGSSAVSDVEIGDVSAVFDGSEQKILDYASKHGYDNKDCIDFFGGKKIVPENIDMLPLSLPYNISNIINEFADIPDSLTDSLTFSIKGDSSYYKIFTGSNAFTYTISAPDLYGKRVSLSWVPATDSDVNIINKYGDIFNTPAYLVNMIPQLCVNGTCVAEGKATGLGYLQEFTIAVKSVGNSTDYITNEVTVGGIYNVAMDLVIYLLRNLQI